MEEFLSVLKLKLMDQLMPDELDAQIALYEGYIKKEIAGGKTLEQVMHKLGDPVKVADMIVAHKRGEDEEGSADAEVVDGMCAGCGGGCFRDSGGLDFDCPEKNAQNTDAASKNNDADEKTRGDAADGTKGRATVGKHSPSMSAQEINARIHNPEFGFHAEFKENEGWDIRLGKLKLNTWYGTLIILGVVLGVFILFSELTH